MTLPQWSLLITPLLPLLLLLAWLRPNTSTTRGQLLPWAALPALCTAMLAPAQTELILEPLLLGGAVWSLAGPARPLLLVTALVWLCAGRYACGRLRRDPHAGRFQLLWLTALAGNLGLIVATDIASFYTFFGLMTFAAYGLVVHDGSNSARYAGNVYLTMALLGEVLLLAGLLWASGGGEVLLLTALPAEIASNPAANWIIALLVTGFGIKAGLPLLHMWLPLAHPAAPPAASAVLSGAMIKAGLVGWLRVLPLGFDTAGLWGWALLVGGVAASFGAALVGVTQRNPKAVLAYSSVSQMGLITSLLGCGLLQPGLWPALQVVIVLFAVHHGLAKGALFLGAGIAHHRRDLPPWLLWAGLVLPGLALAGAPLTSGAG